MNHHESGPTDYCTMVKHKIKLYNNNDNTVDLYSIWNVPLSLTGYLGWTFLLDVFPDDSIPDQATIVFLLFRHNQLKMYDH